MKPLLAFAALALQLAAADPAFDVVSITPCPPGTRATADEHTGVMPWVFPGGRFNAKAANVESLIEWSYGILPSQLTGGPGWINSDRYDIAASAEGSPNIDQMKAMVRTMLADRFHLKTHTAQKEMTSFVLAMGKGAPKFSASKEGEVQSMRMTQREVAGQRQPGGKAVLTRYTVAELGKLIGRQMEINVIDRTGLTGAYNFEIELVPDETRPNPMDPGLLLEALREQLGFDVKSQKTMVEQLVIDAADKVAAGNQ